MFERYNPPTKKVMSKVVRVGFIGAVSVAASACAASEDASQPTVQACGGAAEYSQMASNQSVASAEPLRVLASKEVVILRRRVERARGEIDVADTTTNYNGEDNLTTGPNYLRIAYPSSGSSANGDNTSDFLTFYFTNNKPDTIAIGTVVCTQNDLFYPTAVDTSLERFVKETVPVS